MLVAILADIHANREALDAVVDRLDRIKPDRLVLLGDLVGYGPDPGYVVDFAMRLVEKGVVCLAGNHDAAIAEGPVKMNESARAAILWTRKQLDAAQAAFLKQLPLVQHAGDFLFVHASASNPAAWSYIDGAADAQKCLGATDAAYVICGHTHVPAIYYARAGTPVSRFTPIANKPAPLLSMRRHVIVAGSVGQPRDGNPAACVALLDDEEMTMTMLRVPYDHEATAAKIDKADLPRWLGMRLKIGR